MKLDYPFLQLPLSFDAQVLAQEIEALGESVWRPHPQGFPGNSALPLVSVDGDPANDAAGGPMRPTPQLQACPYLMQAMHSLGAVWGRSRLMRLSGQAEVMPHVDINYYWREHMRVHLPIVTQPTVRFHCGDAVLNMAAGECWIFDTWRLHQVHNDDHRSRIHLVADTVGGRGFWQLMQHCRPHDRRIPGWQPRLVRPDGASVTLDYESVNLPTVMSPWEVREHVAFLLSEAQPGDSLRAFGQGVVAPFVRDWHALWAKYGDTGEGRPEYCELRDLLGGQLARFEGLQLRNSVPLVKALREIVVSKLVLNESGADIEVRDLPRKTPPSPTAQPKSTRLAPPASYRKMAAAEGGIPRFEQPVIILSAPRSGSTLLFETLAKAPGLYTIGGESHRLFESLPGLHPSDRDYDSNRLTAADATPTVVAALLRNFGESLRDRDGKPAPETAVRVLEKTPKNALRLPFLQQVFPDARFVFLYREPHEVLASMIEAWQSGRFRMYADLPGWTGLGWSLLLVPGWRDLIGRPLEEVVARQWATTTNLLLDDLESVPATQLTRIRYDAFVAKPQAEIERLCARLGVEWDIALGDLPFSRHTVSPPDPEKWRRHEATLAKVLPLIQAAKERAERFLVG